MEKACSSLSKEAKEFYGMCLAFTGTKLNVRLKGVEKCEELKEGLNIKIETTLTKIKEKYQNYQPDTSKKFEREKTNLLKKWYHEHASNPYPSEAEKRRLAYVCDMIPKQISTWFGNYRLRYKVKMDNTSKMEELNSFSPYKSPSSPVDPPPPTTVPPPPPSLLPSPPPATAPAPSGPLNNLKRKIGHFYKKNLKKRKMDDEDNEPEYPTNYNL
uniref:Homeobox domain-containing protein n=1 Tax=Arcella intermedia TaxID=1963864 RepID=A0A6B2LH22_9EUKA